MTLVQVLTKDDVITELRHDKAWRRQRMAEDAVKKANRQHKSRLSLTRRVRRDMGFKGVHLHYSTNNALPQSRRARKILLGWVEKIAAAKSTQVRKLREIRLDNTQNRAENELDLEILMRMS